MGSRNEANDSQLTVEERRLRLDEKRVLLESSFAKKWLPTFVTLMVGLIAAIFGYVQQQNAIQDTEQARIEAQAQNEREWGVRVVEMYFSRRDLFDITKNPEQAASNLTVLAAVAPNAVQGVLNAEQSRIAPPSGADDSSRLDSLAAVAEVQDALAYSTQSRQPLALSFRPSDFTIYVQYPAGGQDTAEMTKSLLMNLGYRVPGIEQVDTAPSRLQVRYYRPEQRSYAEDLVTELGKLFNMRAGPDNAILVTSSKQLPSGILEVWLPSQRS